MSTTAKTAIGVALVIALAVGVWLLRPLFVDTVVDEEFPLSASAAVPTDMTQEDVEAEMAAAAEGPDVPAEEPMPAAGPTQLATGTFAGADESHSGAGTATTYALEDGSRVLRLEEFSVTNGPDLHVYLAPLDDAGQPDVDAGVDLGQLKGNVGAQNYDVPGDVDLDRPLAVVIWCQPFRVTFATAPLT